MFSGLCEIYDTKTKVDIILKIAKELENLISEMTSEFLREYVITRCYDEVRIKIAEIQERQGKYILKYKMRRVFGRSTIEEMEIAEAEIERANYDINRLEQYKVKILNKFTLIAKNRYENGMADLKNTIQKLNLNPAWRYELDLT